mmetsp:Transcript_4151/g.12638  ORF Transcript_4151/g.12638 Transcript_4151/m.12638 type:complete len:86 (+) Transcript_4151:81-338(+)
MEVFETVREIQLTRREGEQVRSSHRAHQKSNWESSTFSSPPPTCVERSYKDVTESNQRVVHRPKCTQPIAEAARRVRLSPRHFPL